MSSSACESFERLLVISTKPADLNTAFAIRQIDFDPQPCPSTYRIDTSPTSTVDGHELLIHAFRSRSNREGLRCLPKRSASRFRDSLNSAALALHWTDHRPGMSPCPFATDDDHRYRDNNKQWDDTNAQSNVEIRSALLDSLEELRGIERVWSEDGFELQRTCSEWELSFSKTANQVIDYYNAAWLELETRHLALQVCTACIALRVPYRGIWNACERVREVLTPKEFYQDDYVGLEPESSDTESQAYIFNDYQPYSNGHDAADQHDLSHAKQPYQSKATHQSQPAHENNAAHLRCDPKFKNSRPASVDTEDLIFDCEA